MRIQPDQGTVSRCLAQIAELPQAAFLEEGVDLRWLGLTLRIDPDRIHWHIRRASGIGGSDAGAILAWATGEFASRHSATQIARQKLLIAPPGRTNDDMSRGASIEEFIRGRYEARLTADGHEWRRCTEMEQAIAGQGHPGMPWMRGNVDGIYQIDGEVVLVDFKAPSETSLEEQVRSGVEPDYKVQLNHYALVADGHGIGFDRAELVAFDYRRAGVEDLSRPERFGLRVFPVALDPEMQTRLASACENFWIGCVMAGLVPEDDRGPRMRPEDGLPPHIEDAARRAVMSKFMLESATAQYEDSRALVSDYVRRTGQLGQGYLKIGSLADEGDGFLKVSASPVFDMDGAIARLRELGKDDAFIESLRGPGKWDSPSEAEAKLVKVFEMARGLGDLTQPVEIEAALKALKKATKTPPRRVLGGYDESLVKEALVSCNESWHEFSAERISPVLDRAHRDDIAEMRARVGEGLEAWLATAVPPSSPDQAPDDGWEHPGTAMAA